MSRSPVHRTVTSLLACAAILTLWNCTPESASTVDRETFIRVYVELRASALDSEDATLVEAARERILQRHGITAEELVAFADAHGADVEFMRDLWEEIETRLDVDSISAP